MRNDHAPAAPESRIAIVIVNYKGTTDTIECLESLLKLEKLRGPAEVHIFVVENASPDDSYDRLREWFLSANALNQNANGELVARFDHAAPFVQVTLLRASENRGFAAGCNIGLRCAYRDPSITHFWLLNNDTIADRKAAAELLACSESSGDQCICGSTLLYFHDQDLVQAAAGARYIPLIGRSTHIFKRRRLSEIQNLTPPKFDYIVGASMLFSRNVLRIVGPLPERYFLYVEENDWCTRARSLGVSLQWSRKSYIYHKEGRSTGTEAGFQKLSNDTFYFVARNNLLYVWKYFRRYTPSTLLYTLVEALLLSLRGDGAKMKTALRAITDFWSERKYQEKPRAEFADSMVVKTPNQ